jgi:hypothetical protein
MKVGIAVGCTVCHRMKKPHGRSAAIGACYCDYDCPGYDMDPKPGCLWPNEFGFTCCDNATKEAPDADGEKGDSQ